MEFCVCFEQQEPVLIVPKAHKDTAFDLGYEEWGATKIRNWLKCEENRGPSRKKTGGV